MARPTIQPERGKPTLEDVARLAGVSTATISRVINTPDVVAEATRSRVQQAIDQTGYVPNLLAGGLASNRSRLVAALVPRIASSLFNETIEAMTEELAAAGYLVMLGMAREGDAGMDRTILQLLARRPDALILTAAERSPNIRQRLKQAGVTVIETWDLPARPIDVAIGFSHQAAGRALAELALERGYQRPLIITNAFRRASVRMQSFVDAYVERGLPRPACDVLPSENFSISGADRLARFLDGGGETDLVVCSADLIAQGVLSEAHRRGLRVPKDLGVIGFGASEIAEFTWPALTTVRVDGAEIGRQAAQILLGRSAGREPARRRIDVGFEIVVRDSA